MVPEVALPQGLELNRLGPVVLTNVLVPQQAFAADGQCDREPPRVIRRRLARLEGKQSVDTCGSKAGFFEAVRRG